jgi:glycosyltransferase involved in cell wall biosynthesis
MAKRVPLVSVLVPTYNGARFLDETLLSIRRQTHRNLEIIIRDDGSGDETLDIARRNAMEDRRITVVAEPANAGGRANYIALAQLASGEYLKYCNQDDLLDPACVATLVTPLVSDPRIALATSTRRLIDASGHELPGRPYTAPLVDRDAVIAGRDVIRHLALRHLNQIGEPTTALYRNGVIDPDRMFHFGGREAGVNVDVFLWSQLLLSGDCYFHRAELSSFRIHDGQFSANDVTFVFGHLEWVQLLETAVESGIVARDAECARSAARLLGALDAVAARVAVSTDIRVQGSQADIAAAASWLRSLVALSELRSA